MKKKFMVSIAITTEYGAERDVEDFVRRAVGAFLNHDEEVTMVLASEVLDTDLTEDDVPMFLKKQAN